MPILGGGPIFQKPGSFEPVFGMYHLPELDMHVALASIPPIIAGMSIPADNAGSVKMDQPSEVYVFPYRRIAKSFGGVSQRIQTSVPTPWTDIPIVMTLNPIMPIGIFMVTFNWDQVNDDAKMRARMLDSFDRWVIDKNVEPTREFFQTVLRRYKKPATVFLACVHVEKPIK